jgi:hypothetical protein
MRIEEIVWLREKSLNNGWHRCNRAEWANGSSISWSITTSALTMPSPDELPPLFDNTAFRRSACFAIPRYCDIVIPRYVFV